ncbi:prolyl aminopeptidase [Peptoniphilus sp. GNH]|nr:prolyl aminopeptidase [Clostridiales bacterium KA00134]UHR02592.1 prolyl aminopeptidase [Peptoniphilus sp. GNH]
MKALFPEIRENFSNYIKRDSGHEIYYEESGNPKGRPVVFLHGGPGCGTSPMSRRFFDPDFYRIILFDQRGSGKSKPLGSVENNNTAAIISDMEAIREELGIDKWLVFGGSWGSTLALSYAISHPERVRGLILRGIFLGRQEDIDWIYQEGGVSKIFPEAFEKYKNYIPKEERKDFIAAYYKRLMSDDENIRLEAARIWSSWESSITSLRPKEEIVMDDTYAYSMARIECHFWVNKMFWDNLDYILDHAHIIKDIRTVIVHGRYDMDCLFEGAYLLSKKLENVKLIAGLAGHTPYDEENLDALIEATEAFKAKEFWD